MATTTGHDARTLRLNKVFQGFLRGQRSIASSHDAQIFLEAVTVQSSPSKCLETIVSSPHGLEAVRQSVRANPIAQFLCGHVLPLLAFFLPVPEVKALYGGLFLQQLIATIVEPPTAWKFMTKLYLDEAFIRPDEDMVIFARLCLEIATYPGSEIAAALEELTETLAKKKLLDYTNPQIREIGYQVQKALHLRSSPAGTQQSCPMADSPGGRHDNDFPNIQHIAIYPTADELASTVRPFYRQATEVAAELAEHRAKCHIDNQFRLLREDMMAVIREDVAAVTDAKAPRRRGKRLANLDYAGIDTGIDYRRPYCGLRVTVGSGLEILAHLSLGKRRSFLEKDQKFLRHDSFGAMFEGDKIIGFAFIVRHFEDLSQEVPIVRLRFPSGRMLANVLAAFKPGHNVHFLLLETPIFAYEPVLERLQSSRLLPLQEHLLKARRDEQFFDNLNVFEPTPTVKRLLHEMRNDMERNSGRLLIGDKAHDVDTAQRKAIVNALANPVAIIQGPPGKHPTPTGTGKSYVGALIAKALLESPQTRLLVLSFTNHALDQFLEDLLDIGICKAEVIRLGGKSTERTSSLGFEQQFRASGQAWNSDTWGKLSTLMAQLQDLRDRIDHETQNQSRHPSLDEILEFLEFREDAESQVFWKAFQIPEDAGFQVTGNNGVIAKSDYLIKQWNEGRRTGGTFLPDVTAAYSHVWEMPRHERDLKMRKWLEAMRSDGLETLQGMAEALDKTQGQINDLTNNTRHNFIQTKRVIGCTTTAAAKYSRLITAAQPQHVLVEEAGEIMEAHVLTALGAATEQLILIGDHKQLRPKCKSYDLSVEKGDGYDLNRSLFERLILGGHPHSILRKQHRMAPEISQLIRELTYPELQNDKKTLDRPGIRGIRSRVVFMDHQEQESAPDGIYDRSDPAEKSSKENKFEAQMVLKVVKYLAQQGYKTENMVVLTPYLGQLRLLKYMLSKDTDPILNDMDSYELKRAGMMLKTAPKVGKDKIRLSTIDNYQGEESQIVIASLTRSNNRGKIGFMKAPERLNVLISRARDCLIMMGNMQTFLACEEGQETWHPFFRLMKHNEYIQDGLSLHCEQHPERIVTVYTPEDFDSKCPDGGCSKQCGVKLSCGLHTCQRKCHRLMDHSNVECTQLAAKRCAKDHDYQIKCNDLETPCPECRKEEDEMRRRIQRDLNIAKAQKARQEKYRKEIQAIEDEIAHEKRLAVEEQATQGHTATLQQLRDQLAAVKASTTKQKPTQKSQSPGQDAEQGAIPNINPNHEIVPEPGSAQEDWESLKREERASSWAIDQLMNMIGLESVKRDFLNIKATVDTATRQGASLQKERFGITFLGNPGTGKTTVARLYAKLLTSMGVIAGQRFEETSGSKLANIGVSGCEKMVNDILDAGGGVIFIDEAYQLSSGNSGGGKAVLDFLLAEVENLTGKVCFVLAGYAKQMESFFQHNPGFQSRFPYEMKFDDYTEDELLRILELKTHVKYGGRMKAEDGLRGLYFRIVSRRLSMGRGKEGFGNARAVENILARISRRQAERLTRMRRNKVKADDLLLTKEDMIGPEPGNVLLKSKAWTKLQGMFGLQSVKESLKNLVETLEENYRRELLEQPIVKYSLNRVFLGNPGTGKTTVAELYGKILGELGILSNGDIIVKNPSDFVGAVIGGSEQQTNAILASAVGKVLVIDEAYGLYTGENGGNDPFRTAVIDTIVSKVQNVPGEDRCVLLLGYQDKMEEMFQKVNPGLSRRFPISSAFMFTDFNQDELEKILDIKLKAEGFAVTDKARNVAMGMLDRARNRPNFGNAGEVDILLNEAKARHQKRLTGGQTKRRATLEATDFDEEHDRLDRAETNVAKLFEDTVGCEQVIATLQGFQETVRSLKALSLDPKTGIPFNFLFRGPPGTGKTTTARRMGKVFYDAGFLSNAEVIECSASDMVGQYVGHTGPKVRQLLDKALGRVLFIDEAYRLAEGNFAKEAMDELVDAVTKEKYHKRLIIILAGYEQDINRLLNINPGLTSRFPEVIDFKHLEAEECFRLLTKSLLKQRSTIEKGGRGTMDLSCLETPSEIFRANVCSAFDALATQKSWASARDVETIAKAVFREAIKPVKSGTNTGVVISEGIIRQEMEQLRKERENRGRQSGSKLEAPWYDLPVQHAPNNPITHQSTNIGSSQDTSMANKKDDAEQHEQDTTNATACRGARTHPRLAARDPGVSDEIWNQLIYDAEAEDQRERDNQSKHKAIQAATDEGLRQRILEELIAEEERKEQEDKMRRKLKISGRCPMGYTWIRQQHGWRCAGGSHYTSDKDLQ